MVGISRSAQHAHFSKWLFKKFTTDHKGTRMIPLPGERKVQAEICWKGVYMTDEEHKEITDDVMTAYWDNQYFVVG